MENLLFDLRFALRNLRRRPGFTVVSVLTLALGIGAVTAIFSIARGVLLSPLPFEEPDRLVFAWETQLEGGLPKMFAAPPNFYDWLRDNRTFDGLAAFDPGTFFLAGDDGPVEIRGASVSAGLFDVLGVHPLLGRTFIAQEDRPGAEGVVLLGHDLWRRRFGSDPGVVGRVVTVDEEPRRIVGVMPPGFDFPPPVALEGTAPADKAELWVPLGLDLAGGQRGAHYLTVVGRLAAGVPTERARDDLQGVAAAIAAEHPDTNAGWSVTLTPFAEQVFGRIGPALWLLLAAVGFVLLIACVNLANLLLAQSEEREREFAVRRSLGASAGRLGRQLVTEGIALSLLGGIVGLALAASTLQLLVRLAPANVPRLDQVAVDPVVVACAFALSLATGLLFSAVPAVRSALEERRGAIGPAAARATVGPAGSRAGGALVVAEVALALVLLVGAGLFARSFARLHGVDPGFHAESVLTARVTLPRGRYGGDRPAMARAFGRFESELAALPGVTAAGFVLELPLDADRQGTTAALEGREPPATEEAGRVNFTFLTPGYLRAMGVPILAGRSPEPADRAESDPVVVVNGAFVRRFLPEATDLAAALGERVVLGFNEEPRRIVGVVGDVRHDALARDPFPNVYLPYEQFPWSRGLALAVRSSLPPEELTAAVRERLRSVEPDVAVYRVQTMADVVAASVAEPRFSTLLLAAFAVAALGLAAVGVYGVLAYAVRRRTREIGVRVALGASRSDVVRLVLLRWMGLVLLGIAVGLGASLGLARLVAGFLFRVDPTDPATFAALALFLAAVAAAACYLPTRRALAVDPRVALEAE